MRIGYDITILYIARAGILYYNINLLRQLVTLAPADEFTFVDYVPVRQSLPLAAPIDDLLSPRVQWKVIDGPPHRKAIRWQRLNFTGGRFFAQQVDAVLERPWLWWIDNRTRAVQRSVMRDLDVFHVSDVTQLVPEQGKVVATIYDMSPVIFPQFHTSENRNTFARKLQHIRQHADVLIAISESTKRDIIEHLGFPETRIHVAYGGVDANFAPLPDQAALRSTLAKYGLREPGYILHVGTLEPRKNLVRLIEAYAQVRQRCGDVTPPLVLVGQNGWDSADIFTAVARHKLSDHVQIVGFVADADLPVIYNGATIFAYPSLYEGFGIPVLEAMACGVPVLTSTVSSLPEIVGDTGLLVEATDTQAIAAGLQQLVEDAELRRDLSVRGAVRATRFTWQETALATLNAYCAAA
jgi:glycosyltransferase involved in cell wall biosynthesis